MAYTVKNFRTKKELGEALLAGETIRIQPQLIGETPVNGTVFLEGPHFPESHTWYAEARMENGKVKYLIGGKLPAGY